MLHAGIGANSLCAAYFSAPAIRSLRSIPFNSVLKAGGFSRAGTERAWLEKTGLFFILY